MRILTSIANWWYTLRVKAIPQKDIELIRRGLYCNHGEPDKPGFVPFRKMNNYLDRCLRLRYISHQRLNTDPLSASFLTLYNAITGRNIRFPWDFVSDEEFHHDFIPFIQAGILTDGWRYLYWNVTEDADGRQTCHIHNSILMDSDTEEIAYPWTADNDAKVIDALSDPDNWGYWCGEDSILRSIDFDPWEDMP